jgi:hypothetical protein
MMELLSSSQKKRNHGGIVCCFKMFLTSLKIRGEERNEVSEGDRPNAH